ncbi:hypothetical protein [Ottowia sp. VDI28]|uniref:hypothetical protein n=1 Tax=Ottowia sp. VDI28 TaxID=3133968 RepID=UPI003C2F7D55
MTFLHDHLAFDIFGNPKPIAPLPELRIVGRGMSRDQIQMAQRAFTNYNQRASLSSVPNPVEAGRLPDGSRYKAFTVGRNRYMQVWPADVRDEVATFYVPVGILFGGMVADPPLDGGPPLPTRTYLWTVVSPPGPVLAEWTRQTIRTKDQGNVIEIPNLAPQNYGATRAGTVASPSADYFRVVDFTTGVSRAGLLKIPFANEGGDAVSVTGAPLFREDETIFLGYFHSTRWDGDTLNLRLFRSFRRPVAALSSAGYFEKDGDAFVGKILPAQLAPETDVSDLWEFPIPVELTTLGDTTPTSSYNKDRTRLNLYLNGTKHQPSVLDSTLASGQTRLVELPYVSLNRYYWGVDLEPRQAISWWRRVPTGLGTGDYQMPQVTDFVSGTFSASVDTENDEVLESSWEEGAYVAEPKPYTRLLWVYDPFLVRTKPIQSTSTTGIGGGGGTGVGMMCTASSPVPTLSRSVSVESPNMSRVSWARTISGPCTFNGHSKITSRSILQGAFKDDELQGVIELSVEEIDYDMIGSNTYVENTYEIVPTGSVTPFVPEDLYKDGGGPSGTISSSWSANTTLTVSKHRTAEIDGRENLVLEDALFVETASTSSSGPHAVSHSVQRTLREIAVFNPDLNLLCYLETEFTAGYSYDVVPGVGTSDMTFSSRPSLSTGEWPKIGLVIEHASDTIRLTTNMPVYDDVFIASLHPAAGLYPGYDGGTVSMYMRDAALGGRSTGAGRTTPPFLIPVCQK